MLVSPLSIKNMEPSTCYVYDCYFINYFYSEYAIVIQPIKQKEAQVDNQAFISADRRCHVVSVMDPYSHILSFIDQSRYFFFQAAPQLY
jgi:hypothetical protein